MLSITLSTNKEHFPVWLYSHSSRSTEVAKTEGLLIPKQSGTKWTFNQRPDKSPRACVHFLI